MACAHIFGSGSLICKIPIDGDDALDALAKAWDIFTNWSGPKADGCRVENYGKFYDYGRLPKHLTTFYCPFCCDLNGDPVQVPKKGDLCKDCARVIKAHGYSESEPGESGYRWALLDCEALKEHLSSYDPTWQNLFCGNSISPAQKLRDAAVNVVGWGEYYSGPGRAFGSEPSVRFASKRILVKQFCGLDI